MNINAQCRPRAYLFDTCFGLQWIEKNFPPWHHHSRIQANTITHWSFKIFQVVYTSLKNSRKKGKTALRIDITQLQSIQKLVLALGRHDHSAQRYWQLPIATSTSADDLLKKDRGLMMSLGSQSHFANYADCLMKDALSDQDPLVPLFSTRPLAFSRQLNFSLLWFLDFQKRQFKTEF